MINYIWAEIKPLNNLSNKNLYETLDITITDKNTIHLDLPLEDLY